MADDETNFEKLNVVIPIKKLVLDCSNIFYPNGWEM